MQHTRPSLIVQCREDSTTRPPAEAGGEGNLSGGRGMVEDGEPLPRAEDGKLKPAGAVVQHLVSE